MGGDRAMMAKPLTVADDHPSHPTQECGPVVVDADGSVIVVRTQNGYGTNTYHHIDPDEFENGAFVPRCSDHDHTRFDNKFIARRRVDIESAYECCRWEQCGGDYTSAERPNTCHPETQSLLSRLTVDQFDRLVAEARSREGGL